MSGMKVGTWIKIDYCTIEATVCGDAVEFDFGGSRSGITLTATEYGLERLLAAGTEALKELRAKQATSDTAEEAPVPT